MTIDPPVRNAPITFSGATARFVVGGNRSAKGLLCSLDGAAAAECPWPLVFEDLPYNSHRLTVTDPNLPGVVLPTIAWANRLPKPRIVGSQFPAVLQPGSRRRQASLAVARLPRMLFQSNAAGTAKVTLRRGRRSVAKWRARVVQGSNLVRLPKAAGRKLRPGRYTLVVVVRNAAGASAPFTLRFDALRDSPIIGSMIEGPETWAIRHA